MTPFFSIVIPTYNRAGFLIKAMGSVLQQTFEDWELIVVDDGSTDNTEEAVLSFRDKRIKYVYQNNSERSAARNNGISRTSGKYICFLDSDDYYLPQRLNSLYNELEQRNFPVIAFYTGLLVEQNGTLNEKEEWMESESVYDNIVMSVIHSQQVCIHRKIFSDFKFDTQFHIGEDMELWLRIAEKYPFVHINHQLSIVVVDHDDRSVNVKQYNSYPDQMRMLKRIFADDHPGNKISFHLKKRLLGNCYYGIAKYYLYQSNFLKARYYLFRSVTVNLGGEQAKYRLNILLQTLPLVGNKIKLFGLVENRI